MQLKKIAFLTALACAGFAGQAQAALSGVPADIVTDANTNGRVIFISGASAVQKGFTGIIGKLFNTDIANGGAALTYMANANADVSGTNYVAVAGIFSSDETNGVGTWGGEKGIVIYRVLGGSVIGVDPVARNTAIESLHVTAADCGTAGVGSSASPYVCPVTNGTTMPHRVPDAGVSDVAPALFKGPTNTEGETAAPSLTEEELTTLTSTPLYGLAFGVAANNNVNPAIDFNKSALSALYTGNVKGWEKIKSGETGDVVICRRVPGSGTQAVFNMHFGNFPCTSDANKPADRTSGAPAYVAAAGAVPAKFVVNASMTSTGTASKLWVVENSTSGDVRTCLDTAQTGGTYNTKDRDGNTIAVTFSGPAKAIGTLSMDSLDKSKTSGKWAFRSLDGHGKMLQDTANAAPNFSAGATGKFPIVDLTTTPVSGAYIDGTWDLQGWISFNVPQRTIDDAAEKKEALDRFVALAQDPAVLNSVNALKFVTAAIPESGYTTGQVLRASYLNNNQCAPYNRNK